MADYWIKLYLEIIDDPKMATLPDRLWRRVIELFLLAGKTGLGGQLPDTRQLAWMLRMEVTALADDLQQLISTGIIEPIPNGWNIVKFSERQAPVNAAERKRQERSRKQREQYYGNVTEQSRSVTQINRLTDTETDSETDTDKTTSSRFVPDDSYGQLATAYEKNIGALTPMVADMLAEDLEEYGLEPCLWSIEQAVAQNIRKWNYVRGILKNVKVNGYRANKKMDLPEPKSIVLPGGEVVNL